MSPITFRSRLVEAAGSPWLTAEEEIHDDGVARDFLSSLRSPYGAAVVLAMRGREVTAEWLCGDGDDPNGEIARRGASRSREAKSWFASRTCLDAWEKCPSGAWLVSAAEAAGVAPRLVAAAAAACAAAAMPLPRPAPPRGIVPAGWGDAHDYFGHAMSAADAARLAAARGDHDLAMRASELAVVYAATAMDNSPSPPLGGGEAETADLVRRHVPAIEYLRPLRGRR